MNDGGFNPVAAMMERMQTGGFDALDFGSLAERQRSDDIERRAKAMADAAPVLQLFTTHEGQLVLEWLVRLTLLRGPNEQQLTARNAEDYAIACAKREGQNSIVMMIFQAMHFAATGKEGSL